MRIASPTSSRLSSRSDRSAGTRPAKSDGPHGRRCLGSTLVEIAEIDVHDDAQVEALWSAAKAGDELGRPYAAFWSLEAATLAMRAPNSAFERHPFAAFVGGELVGSDQIVFPLLDNTHVAFLTVIVTPSARRRGVGAALLEHGIEYARSRGRTSVVVEVNRPMTESGPGESAGHALLAKYGFSDASVDLHRVLDLPVGDGILDRLDAETVGRLDGYRLVRFTGVVPDDQMAGFCRLQEAFLSEAPLGDLDFEPEVWDAARVREREALFERAGRRERATAVLAPDDTMVALTEMMTTDQHPGVAWQGGTLVLKAHRGRRLGLVSKVANLRAFQREFQQARVVHSWNAEQNGPMVAINDALGFRPVEYLVEMQRRL
jgi:GNAT superfamily N-acetyltransferase